MDSEWPDVQPEMWRYMLCVFIYVYIHMYIHIFRYRYNVFIYIYIYVCVICYTCSNNTWIGWHHWFIIDEDHDGTTYWYSCIHGLVEAILMEKNCFFSSANGTNVQLYNGHLSLACEGLAMHISISTFSRYRTRWISCLEIHFIPHLPGEGC